jgi:ankyrin repeat protein
MATVRPPMARILDAGDHVELQRLVLEEPPLVTEEIPGTGKRPLSYACFSSHLAPSEPHAGDLVTCIEVLLAAGADPNETHRTEAGDVPAVHGAARVARNPEAVRLLLEAGARLDGEPV